MTRRRGALVFAVLVLAGASVVTEGVRLGGFPLAAASPAAAERGGVTVRDAIEMTRIRPGSFAFSPDGHRFAYVVWRGDLDDFVNRNELYVVDTAARAPRPVRPLATIERDDRTERGAVFSGLSFIDGARAVAFLAPDAFGRAQIQRVDVESGEVRFLTNHPAGVQSFRVADDGVTVLFVAPQAEGPRQDSLRLHGFSVFDITDGPPRAERVGGGWLGPEPGSPTLHVLRLGEVEPRVLPTPSAATGRGGVPTIFIPHPDGTSALIWPFGAVGDSTALHPYAHFRRTEFTDLVDRVLYEGTVRDAAVWGLLDLSTGEVARLIDAPAPRSGGENALWLPDRGSVVIQSLLPLSNVVGYDAESAALAEPHWVEVDLSSRETRPLAPAREWTLLGWDPGSRSLAFVRRTSALPGTNQRIELGPDGRFARLPAVERGDWGTLTDIAPQVFNGRSFPASNGQVVVGIVDDLTTPPEIGLLDLASGRHSVVTDLNPALRQRTFSPIEHISWDGPIDTGSTGYLVRPLGYTPGERYPLVILLADEFPVPHDRSFLIDGQWQTAGFAIQPLAASGFVVLFTPFPPSFRDALDQSYEIDNMLAHVRAGVELLDRQGLIDPTRIGVSGFSRAGYNTNRLIMTDFPFGAAVQIDGGAREYYGSRPFTEEELLRIRTPVLVHAHGIGVAAHKAPYFDALERLGRAADMIVFPDGIHNLIAPGHRYTSLTSSVDWFRFWLQDYEDPSPAKAGQYARWRSLKAMASESETAAGHVPRN
jgi:dipeptidyl aminopeptidase/acylaminoacyl peptidase